jgi:WD40 repeat protein
VAEPLLGHSGGVTDVAYSPDGTTLASVDWSGQVFLWDVASRQRLGELTPGDGSWVYQLAFSPDGRYLASGDSWGVSVWDLDPEALLQHACRMANRDLTQEEWTQFVGADVPYEPACS